MSKTGRYILELEDKFYGEVEEFVKKSTEFKQALVQAEISRQVDYPWIDESDCTELVQELWLEYKPKELKINWESI